VLNHVQPDRGHRNTPLLCFFISTAFLSPSFSAPAQWGEDPLEMRPIFSVTKVTNGGFLRFGMKSSHSIAMIFSWLN
jgi:hypothetical protein